MCRIYYSAFYARRSLGAAYRECRQVNKRCELPPRPKKPRESQAGRGKGRGLGLLGGAAPPSIGSKMGEKKGGRDKRDKRDFRGGTSSNKIVFI